MTRIEFYGNLNKYKDVQDKNNELMHYGTLGQKWGVRKWQNYDGTFNEAGKERYFGKNGATKNSNENQKIGMTGVVDIIMAVNAITDGITNYKETRDLREAYSKFMKESDVDYSPEERLSVMHNKKKIPWLYSYLGNEKMFEKVMKQIPDKDKDAVRKFMDDFREKDNQKKVSQENQEKLDEAIGSISKPKINKKYLNEDGTLNDAGKMSVNKSQKRSDVASSVFKALRYMNIFEATSAGLAGLILTFTGFGVPAALAGTLASGIFSASAGVDHALYKKLEKRADAYYEMLQ